MSRDLDSSLEPMGRAPWREVVTLGAVVLGAAVLYLVRDGQALFFDEYYHLLAGRSWEADGRLTIADGAYERSAWLSIAVGWVLRVSGGGLLPVRLAMGILTALWAAVLFTWVHRHAGRASAWIVALCFGLGPLVLMNSVMIRFYGVAGLLVTVSAMATMRLARAEPNPRHWLPPAVVALGASYLAYQVTTLTRIWLAGAALWLLGVISYRLLQSSYRRILVVAPVVAVVLLGALWWAGWIQDMWVTYRAAPLWSAPRAGELRWYERVIRGDYPTLWTLLPVAAVVAIRRAPHLASLAISMFLVGFVLLSGAGPKAERYALPLLPFFFIPWGVAAPVLLGRVWAWTEDLLDLLTRVPLRGGWRGVAAALLTGISIVFVLGTNPGFTRVRTVVTGDVISQDRPWRGQGASPDQWEALAPILREAMGRVDAVVTANSLQTLYHVGDYDFEMHPTLLPEVTPPEDFGIDSRTGRPVIGTLESLVRVVESHPTGLIFGEVWRWGGGGGEHGGFNSEVEAFVDSTMVPLDLPVGMGVIAYTWDRNGGG